MGGLKKLSYIFHVRPQLEHTAATWHSYIQTSQYKEMVQRQATHTYAPTSCSMARPFQSSSDPLCYQQNTPSSAPNSQLAQPVTSHCIFPAINFSLLKLYFFTRTHTRTHARTYARTRTQGTIRKRNKKNKYILLKAAAVDNCMLYVTHLS